VADHLYQDCTSLAEDEFSLDQVTQLDLPKAPPQQATLGLSTVEVACLFSIKHVLVVAKEEGTFNFAATYSVYQEHARRQDKAHFPQPVFQKVSLLVLCHFTC
jgi:hypothetical protein